jgi:hypothetical protein
LGQPIDAGTNLAGEACHFGLEGLELQLRVLAGEGRNAISTKPVTSDHGVRTRGLITRSSRRQVVKTVLSQTSWLDVRVPLMPISHSGWRHQRNDRRLVPANGPYPSADY